MAVAENKGQNNVKIEASIIVYFYRRFALNLQAFLENQLKHSIQWRDKLQINDRQNHFF